MTRDQSGFSMLEALVALTIIAAMASALSTTLASHARIRGTLVERRLALMIAQSALARVEAGERTDSGTWHDLSWHVMREPYEAGGSIGAGSSFGAVAPLEHVSVVVEDELHRKVITLQSVRIVP